MAQGVSQERLAFDAGIDRAYVGGIERKTENPSIDILERLAATLRVEIAELFVQPAPDAQAPTRLKAGRRPNFNRS